MSKNLIITGAGPGLSKGLAEKFGQEGFTIGLISRNKEKLENEIAELKAKGVNAFFALADAYKKDEITKAIETLKNKMGKIDSLIYNAAALKMKYLMEETVDELVEDFKISAVNAFHAVKILHNDLKDNQGTVLFTGGAFAITPNSQFGSLSLGKAALRNLAFQLNQSLKSDNIFVGTITIDGYIQHSSETHSPKILADKFWQLHKNRTNIEIHY